MPPIFNRLTLIGTGLIGGSIGLACKAHGSAAHIIGYSRSQATIDAALTRGIMDEGTTDLAKAVQGSDCVILCTPLGTYRSIIGQIAPHLTSGTLISDAGSVKQAPNRDILQALAHEQQPYFVPGHPIAGTENSGPEAAFATLFERKKTILTPLTFTNPQATQILQRFWESLGAQVELLDERRHDFIYASVSHAIQFISSVYALAALEFAPPVHNFQPHVSDHFRHFIRLVGSDSTMWQDIYRSNLPNLDNAITTIRRHLLTLGEAITLEEVDRLQQRLLASQEKRLHFQKVLSASTPVTDAPDISVMPDDLRCWMAYLPKLIACAVMESIAESEYDYATGSGLHGLTEPALFVNSSGAETLIAAKSTIVPALNQVVELMHGILSLAKEISPDALYDKLENARQLYIQLSG